MALASIGRYQITRQIGTGGMGAVYEAVHGVLDGHVAIKLLPDDELARDRETLARFRREAVATNRAAHPGIVQVVDFDWAESGQPYIVMELLTGETLASRLARDGGGLPVIEATRYARMLAGALAAVHEQGIIHRDLKPLNVMLVADPDVPGGIRTKIMDFGIAKVFADEDSPLSQDEAPTHVRTNQRTRLGTPTYMSPEQLLASSSVTPAADVYSLGVMLYELLLGKPPFDGERIEWKHARELPAELIELRPELPTSLCNLVHRMLEKPPESRPSMREVEQGLASLSSALHLAESVPPVVLPRDSPASAATPQRRTVNATSLTSSEPAELATQALASADVPRKQPIRFLQPLAACLLVFSNLSSHRAETFGAHQERLSDFSAIDHLDSSLHTLRTPKSVHIPHPYANNPTEVPPRAKQHITQPEQEKTIEQRVKEWPNLKQQTHDKSIDSSPMP